MKTFLRFTILTAVFAIASIAQTTGSLLPWVNYQYFTNGGQPLASGKICTYAAGTTTKLATYTDATLNVQNSNPVRLDASGRAAIWIGTGNYTIVIQNPGDNNCPGTGSIIRTVIGVSAASNGGGGSATQITFEPTGGDVLTNVGAALNSTFIYDIGFSTAALACASTKTVAVTSQALWDNLATMTCTAPLWFPTGVGVSIKPASGQTVSLTGAITASLSKIFDYSLGGTVDLTGAKLTAVYPEWWGAKADFVFPSTVATDSRLPIGSALLQGKLVQLSRGNYYSSGVINTTLASTTIAGMGNGDITCATAATCLVFAAGVQGLTSGSTAYDWTVRDLTLFSLSSGASAGKHGIAPGTGPIYVSRVTGIGFAGDGFNATSVNVNNSQFVSNFFYANYGRGWYCSSTDCNLMRLEGNRALNNGGIGIDLANGATVVMIANDSEGNNSGGDQYYIAGVGNFLSNNYCESAGAMTLAATGSVAFNPAFGACTISNTGGVSNAIWKGSQLTGNISISGSALFGTDLVLSGNQVNLNADSANTDVSFNFSGKANIPFNVYNGSGAVKASIKPNAASTFVNGLSTYYIAGGAASVSGCSRTSVAGGQVAGAFISGVTGTCTVVIALPTAINAWTCVAQNLGIPANRFVQTDKAVDSCTMSGTTGAGDYITFMAIGW